MYSHPKCYANRLGDCSEKISREHIISNCVLKTLESNNKIKIAGLPWQEYQTFDLRSSNDIVSNILCEKHNSILAKYDKEALELFQCIKGYDKDFNSKKPKTKYIRINGDYIEKWMLQRACALIASKSIHNEGQSKDIKLNKIFLDILFKNEKWPEGWGLYFNLPKNNIIQKYDSYSTVPITYKNEIKAMEFLIHNFKFYLLLGKPDHLEHFGIFRVNKIHLTNNQVVKTIEFEWPDRKYTKWVQLTRDKTTNQHPEEWEDWMKK